MRRPIVYIAGPISKGDMAHNIGQANDAQIALMKAGFAPINPMLSVFVGYPHDREPNTMPRGTTHADWMGMDLPLVEVCDALLRLPGESKGADNEVAHARLHNIPVFHDLDSLVAAFT